MTNVLADFMISGEWLTAFVVAVLTAFGGIYAKARKDGVKSASESREVQLKEPVAEVPVKRVYTPPTFSQHQDVVRRVNQLETDVRDIRKEQAEHFRTLLEVGEERKDKIFEKMDTMARGFHARVDQILHEGKGKKS